MDESSKRQGWKILVVDDEEGVLYAISHLLRTQGYDVLEAASGAECLQQVEKTRPDLVLLDIVLPDINGVDVLKEIKSRPEWANIFVVLSSAKAATAKKKLESLDLGADGYITQPVDNNELLVRVRGFLRHKTALDALRESETRYRNLFESNPLPMWIYDKVNFQILAVNTAAIHHYGFSREEFLRMSMQYILPETQHEALRLSLGGSTHYGRWSHRTKSGNFIEVETSEQDIHWASRCCRALLAHDVTERVRAEQERIRQLERFERELRSLGRLSTDYAAQNETLEKDRPLRERASSNHERLLLSYHNLLNQALENRLYKTKEDTSDRLRHLATELFRLRASARDVIEIHYHTLRKAAPVPELPKAQAIIEIGRVTLLELLGYLVSAYRQDYAPDGLLEKSKI